MATKRLASDNDDVLAYAAGSKKQRIGVSDCALSGGSYQKHGIEDYTVGWICAITAEYIAA